MLQCQHREYGIQCTNQSIPSSSSCALHQRPARPAPPPNRQPEIASYDSDIPEAVDYEDDPGAGFCAAQTRLGNPCMASKRKGRPYCISHDPEFRRQHLINCQQGGINARRRREGIAALLDVDVVDLRTRRDIQALIDAVLRLELSGRVPATRTRTIARLISLAVRNFDGIPRANRLDGEVAMHDPGYYDTRNALDLEIEDIASALERGEATEADRSVRTRRSILEAENELRPRPKSARKALLDTLSNLATRP